MPKFLFDIWNDLKLTILMLKDCYTGVYRETPLDTIAALLIMIVYIVVPIDLILDFIPVVGYIDDFIVVKLILSFVKKDLEKYSAWRTTHQYSNDTVFS